MTTDEPQASIDTIEREDEPEADAAAATDGESAPPALSEPIEEPPGWVERYLMAIVMPVLIVAGLVFYVVNVSRMFLSTPGAGAVIIAVTITVSILVGATMLSAAPNMRTSSIALVVIGGMLLVLAGGSLTIGASEEHEEGPAFPTTLPEQQYDVASFNLGFDPTEVDAETGLFAVTLRNTESGGHNFTIETPGLEVQKVLEVSGQGVEDTGQYFAAEAGEFVFFCSIPGHRQAGMEGTIVVTGDPKTFEEAAAGGGAPAE
jgi:plastocyanin